MPRHSLALAVLAVGLLPQALAQKGSWGDGHAAIFNAPIGYEAPKEPPDAAKSGRNVLAGKRKPAQKRTARSCTYEIDGIGPNLGEATRPEDLADFPESPCTGVGDVPAARAHSFGNNLTVVTTGAWTTSVADIKQSRAIEPPAVLNGGLSLD